MVCLSCGKPGNCAAPAPLRLESSSELTDFSCRYPMYVIPVVEFLKLERLLPHQELKQRRLLRKWTPDLHGRVICVSHQWLSYHDPDPNAEHLHALNRVLSRLMDGSTPKVELYWLQKLLFRSNKDVCTINWRKELPSMYIWMDYMSMPQVLHAGSMNPQHVVEAAKAVKSIPAYFERCALLLVLAPVCSHQDTGEVCNYASWRDRGWCRLEMTVALLARSDIRVMVCPGAEAIPYFIWPFDMIWLPAGEGRFSCCSLDHCFGACDKVHLRSVLEDMFDAKAHHLRKTGQTTEFRYLAVQRDVFLRGLPETSAEVAGANPLMKQLVCAERTERMRLEAERVRLEPAGNEYSRLGVLRGLLHWTAKDDADAQRTGCSLLLWAAFAGDVIAVRELLQDPNVFTDIDLDLKQNVPDLPCMFKGLTPLIAAMGHADFDTVRVLLDARANPYAVTVQRYDALMSATITGKSRNVREWLKHFPRWNLGRTDLQFDATVTRIVGGSAADRTATMTALIEAKASMDSREMLCASSAWQEDSEPKVIKLLLDRGCDVNIPWEPSSLKLRAFFKACILMECVDRGRFVAECAAFAGNTALHFAAKRGDVALVRFLVKSRAEPRKNYQGRTPLEVAKRMFGGKIPPLLLSALRGEDAPVPEAARMAGA